MFCITQGYVKNLIDVNNVITILFSVNARKN